MLRAWGNISLFSFRLLLLKSADRHQTKQGVGACVSALLLTRSSWGLRGAGRKDGAGRRHHSSGHRPWLAGAHLPVLIQWFRMESDVFWKKRMPQVLRGKLEVIQVTKPSMGEKLGAITVWTQEGEITEGLRTSAEVRDSGILETREDVQSLES